ncbi:MAG: hypothetical protein ACYTBJ_17085 [Planctomycetota bacterium]|jgi:Tfp pilus assembly protein PilO
MTSTTRGSREKLLAIIIGVLIAGVAVFMVVIEPQLKERGLRLKRLHQLQLRRTKMRRDMLIKDRIDYVYAQIEPLIASSRTEHQEISAFVRQLTDLYLRLGVKPRTVEPLETTDEEFYKRLEVKIEMSGHIRSILSFISAIETSTTPVRIERFDLTAQDIVDNVRASFVISKVVAKKEI